MAFSKDAFCVGQLIDELQAPAITVINSINSKSRHLHAEMPEVRYRFAASKILAGKTVDQSS
jgi:hypothetical protein